MATLRSTMVNAFALVVARFSEVILTKAQNGEFTPTQTTTLPGRALLRPNYYPIPLTVR